VQGYWLEMQVSSPALTKKLKQVWTALNSLIVNEWLVRVPRVVSSARGF